jgi:hypothetical protein
MKAGGGALREGRSAAKAEPVKAVAATVDKSNLRNMSVPSEESLCRH